MEQLRETGKIGVKVRLEEFKTRARKESRPMKALRMPHPPKNLTLRMMFLLKKKRTWMMGW
jgi:hypothetical protein